LISRLRARPARRRCSEPAYIETQTRFNRWFKIKGQNANPPVECLDTSTSSIDETCLRVTAWIIDKTKGI
jgi:hypothetical protein